MSDDAQRYADELDRCHRLSLDVTAPAPPQRTVQLRDARYYADRARVLTLVGVERGVAFLREETLRALTGDRDGGMERWFRLHCLEFGGPPIEHVNVLMGKGVRKLEGEGVADMVAESCRTERRGWMMGRLWGDRL
jgi:hypothetical protein